MDGLVDHGGEYVHRGKRSRIGDYHSRISEGMRNPPQYESTRNYDRYGSGGGTVSRRRRGEEETTKSVSKRAKAKEKAASFAEFTTVAGLIWIKNATSWYARAFWILAFAGMLGVLIWHLYYITNRYYSWPMVTKFSIKSDIAADFPSVTVCNLNPIKSVELVRNPALQNFTNQLIGIYEGAIRYQTGPGENETGSESWSDYYDYHIPDYFGDAFGSLDDSYEIYYGSESEAVFGGTADSTVQLENQFRELIGEIDPKERKKMGHDSKLMILKCTFNGKTCYSNNFTHTFSESYGNCYTFNSAKASNVSYTTRFVGATHGLTLQLYLESSEHLNGITQGRGFRVAVHPYGTLPFPDELGYSIAAGMETFVGIRQRKFSRLNEPYAPCEEGLPFKEKYDSVYTKKTCNSMCRDTLIAKMCSCWVGQRIEYYSTGDIRALPRCSNSTTLEACKNNVTNQVLSGAQQCACERECRVIDFTRQISSNVWPDYGLYSTLGTLLCNKDEGGPKCEEMLEAQETEVEIKPGEFETIDASSLDLDWYLRHNFAKLNVYFNDLNYDEIVEEAEYPLSNFAADIGGTIGLWLGLSVFSVIELAMLVAVLFRVIGSNLKERQQQRNVPRYHDRNTMDYGDGKDPRGRHPFYYPPTDSGRHHLNWGRPLPPYYEHPPATRF